MASNPNSNPTSPTAPTLFPPCAGNGLRIGLGGAPLGNLFAPVRDVDARALIDAAWSGGCRYYDTAPHYGHGLSERRIGDALRARPRDEFVLSTKVGRLLTPARNLPREQHGFVDGLPFVQHWDFSAAGVRRSLEDSLQRLGLSNVDIAFVHDCDAITQGQANAARVLGQVLAQALPALQRMKSEGLVRAIGLGVNDVQVVLDVLRYADIDALLLAGRYTLLDQTALHDLLPLVQERGIALALGGVFNSGLLAQGSAGSGADVQATFNYEPAAPEWVERTRRIEVLCAKHEVPLRAAALQFALARPAVQTLLVGARDVAQWGDAIAMLQRPIDPEFWLAMRQERLIPDSAPTPSAT